MLNTSDLKAFLKAEAKNLGFAYCGVAKTRRLDEEADRLEKWLKAGKHGKMTYMENHFDMRLDPRLLVPGAKSVIVLMFNYFPAEIAQNHEAPKVARYAYGEDYHFVIKDKLHELVNRMREKAGDIQGRVFVDSAPVMERVWAKEAGIGWVGKNTLLINPRAGSWYFLAEIISDLELEPDAPIGDYCGTCTACIDACPTDAITPYQLDASKCISYLTIELKEAIPQSFAGKMDDWVFGCDICQEVCPWNRFSKPHQEPRFDPLSNWYEWNSADWIEMTEAVFVETFKKSPLKRAGFSGIKKNLEMLNGTS